MNWFHRILNQRQVFVYEVFTYKARKHSSPPASTHSNDYSSDTVDTVS